MFSLIITIISIALVAALALATLYYGGDAFKRGAASADATKLHVQAQQLQGAAELYKADTGDYPLTMEVMLTGNYLKSIPVSSLDPAQETGSRSALMAQASAAGVVWKMVLAGYPVFAMTQVSVAVCEAVNMKAYGISGILKSARAGYATQCFGPDLDNLTMVTTKSGAALLTASLSPLATVDLGTVLTTAPPAVNSGDTTDAGWLTVEGVTVAVAPVPGPEQEVLATIDSGVDRGVFGPAPQPVATAWQAAMRTYADIDVHLQDCSGITDGAISQSDSVDWLPVQVYFQYGGDQNSAPGANYEFWPSLEYTGNAQLEILSATIRYNEGIVSPLDTGNPINVNFATSSSDTVMVSGTVTVAFTYSLAGGPAHVATRTFRFVPIYSASNVCI